jgi:hypothetical protein
MSIYTTVKIPKLTEHFRTSATVAFHLTPKVLRFFFPKIATTWATY